MTKLTSNRWQQRRATGSAEVVFSGESGVSRLRHLRQNWPCRVLFPASKSSERPEIVLANTSGGMVAGDTIKQTLEAKCKSKVTFTSQAAEKIYRSDGDDCNILTDIKVGNRCQFEWIPQETILFESSRLRRTTRIHLDKNSILMASEMIVFGRRTRGEKFHYGSLHDIWEIYVEDNLLWTDRLCLDSGVNSKLRGPFAFGNTSSLAMMIFWVPDPVPIRNLGRILLKDNQIGGFTIVNGLVIGRFASNDAAELRELIPQIWIALRKPIGLSGHQMPRVWNL